MTKLETVRRFLDQKRMAIVGVSRDPKSYSRIVLREFAERGYEVSAVSRTELDIDGMHCVSHISEITPAPSAAILLVPEVAMAETLSACVAAGIKHLWIRRLSSAVQKATLELPDSERENLTLIQGLCPLMFLPNAHFIHRLHGGLAKMFGQYPK